jgi:hypothetical protein
MGCTRCNREEGVNVMVGKVAVMKVIFMVLIADVSGSDVTCKQQPRKDSMLAHPEHCTSPAAHHSPHERPSACCHLRQQRHCSSVRQQRDEQRRGSRNELVADAAAVPEEQNGPVAADIVVGVRSREKRQLKQGSKTCASGCGAG